MVRKVDDFVERINRALTDANKYSNSLDIQIYSLASALRTLNLANDEIDKLKITTVDEVTRYGKKKAPHPVFKVQKDAQDSVTRQMKALGLTAEDLVEETVVEDPLVALTEKVKEAGKSPKIIKPKKED